MLCVPIFVKKCQRTFFSHGRQCSGAFRQSALPGGAGDFAAKSNYFKKYHTSSVMRQNIYNLLSNWSRIMAAAVFLCVSTADHDFTAPPSFSKPPKKLWSGFRTNSCCSTRRGLREFSDCLAQWMLFFVLTWNSSGGMVVVVVVLEYIGYPLDCNQNEADHRVSVCVLYWCSPPQNYFMGANSTQ